jgi:hypothetical protein
MGSLILELELLSYVRTPLAPAAGGPAGGVPSKTLI